MTAVGKTCSSGRKVADEDPHKTSGLLFLCTLINVHDAALKNSGNTAFSSAELSGKYSYCPSGML
jgi:hypothetical protein